MSCRMKLEAVTSVLTHGAAPVLDNVDWEIDPGVRVGLIGPNGAGKTTLARVLAGLLRPNRGRLLIDGRDIWAADAAGRDEARRGIQLLLQNPSSAVHPRLTVTEALRETVRAHLRALTSEDARTAIGRSLEAFGLEHRAHALAGELSGGELRRLGLARALLARPRLLILDEPTAGLDAALKGLLMRQILEACPPTTAVVWICHDLEVLLCACDRIAALHEGRLVEQLDVAQLRSRRAEHPVTRQLLDAWDALASPGVRYGGRVPSPTASIHPRPEVLET